MGAGVRRIAVDRWGAGGGAEEEETRFAAAAGVAVRTEEEGEEEEEEEEEGWCSTAGAGTCPWQAEEGGEEGEHSIVAAARIREAEEVGVVAVGACPLVNREEAADSTGVVAAVAVGRTRPWRAVVGEEGEHHPYPCQTGRGPRQRVCEP